MSFIIPQIEYLSMIYAVAIYLYTFIDICNNQKVFYKTIQFNTENQTRSINVYIF